MTETFTINIKRYAATDPRLGRHVRHDSRSLNYQVIAEGVETLKSVRHKSYIPVLDQGDLGSCTGNAATGCLGTGLFWPTLPGNTLLNSTDAAADEAFAVDLYSAATAIDSYTGTYPPTDSGSDGLSVAQVLKARGLISGYLHATSLEAVLTALSKQPVIVGTEYLSNMFKPGPDGRLNVSGSIAGGHEYVLDELNVESQLVWMRNSWGAAWGIQGRAYMTWHEFDALLKRQGDCTVFLPNTLPAPTPTPPAPAPTPVPPAPTDDFRAAAESFRIALNKYLGD